MGIKSNGLPYQTFAVLLLLAGTILPAQTLQHTTSSDSQNEVTLQVSSRLVQLSVSVTHRGDNEPIEGLTVHDFTIKDNGHLRPISNFAHGVERTPLRVVFLIESAGAETKTVNGLIEALPKALNALHETDEIGVASVFPGYKIVLEPTLSRAAIPVALAQVRDDQLAYLQAEKNPNKQQRPKVSFGDLNQAITAISNRETYPDKQKHLVIVLVTDDFDLLNRTQSADAAKLLLKNGTETAAFVDLENPGMAYAASYAHVMTVGTPLGITTRDHGASYFAKMTGGPVIQVKNQDYLAAIQHLLRIVSDSYQMGFVPPQSEIDGKFHKVTVLLTKPDLKDKAQVNCRQGYWANH